MVNVVRLPTFPRIVPLTAPKPCKIVFVSNLLLNSPDFDLEAGRSLVSFINGDECVLLFVIIGSTFATGTSQNNEDWKVQVEMTDISPLTMLSDFLSPISCKKLIIPGQSDPVEGTFPQGPLPHFFCDGISFLDRATNPAWFEVEHIPFLCCSGDPVLDVVNETGMDYGDVLLSLLEWRLIAPTSPGGFGCYLNANLIMDEVPNFFVCGGATEMVYRESRGVRAIGVADFTLTRAVVVVNLCSGEVVSNCFGK
jgi:DNA polymerase II small subunit/DNA polymerase delta subunit B